MIQSVLILSRLTFLMASVMGWDANATRTNIPLIMYLDCLCYRFMDLSGTKAEGIEDAVDPDIMFVFKMMLGSVKRSYEKRVGDIKAGSFQGVYLFLPFIHFHDSLFLVLLVLGELRPPCLKTNSALSFPRISHTPPFFSSFKRDLPSSPKPNVY